MIVKNEYFSLLDAIRGKTIAVVYVFEGEDASGYNHYDVWRSNVISTWLAAIQNLQCMPLIMDIRTFIFKAMNKSLPKIDYILNLNAGHIELSTLGLLPSISGFLAIPCIPCTTTTIIAGEHKRLSNIIASSSALNVPKNLHSSIPGGVTKPINFGSSIGISRGFNPLPDTDCLYQEFIEGYDITTPVMYNPLSEELEILPTNIYLPSSNSGNWMYGEEDKISGKGFTRVSTRIDDRSAKRFIELAQKIAVTTYCRIDSRVQCTIGKESEEIFLAQIPHEKIFFLEINPMPTIESDVNFLFSLSMLKSSDSFYECFQLFKERMLEKRVAIYNDDFESASLATFVLSCSMISHLKAKYKKTLAYTHTAS